MQTQANLHARVRAVRLESESLLQAIRAERLARDREPSAPRHDGIGDAPDLRDLALGPDLEARSPEAAHAAGDGTGRQPCTAPAPLEGRVPDSPFAEVSPAGGLGGPVAASSGADGAPDGHDAEASGDARLDAPAADPCGSPVAAPAVSAPQDHGPKEPAEPAATPAQDDPSEALAAPREAPEPPLEARRLDAILEGPTAGRLERDSALTVVSAECGPAPAAQVWDADLSQAAAADFAGLGHVSDLAVGDPAWGAPSEGDRPASAAARDQADVASRRDASASAPSAAGGDLLAAKVVDLAEGDTASPRPAVFHLHRAADASPHDPATDLGALPGAGPGLVWMLGRCGVRSLADLADADAGALRGALGLIGELVDVGAWIDFAKARTAR